MKFKHIETLKLTDRWRLTAHYKGTKRIFKIIDGDDLVVTVGKELVADWAINTGAPSQTGLTYLALGSNSGAPAVGETQLVDEGGGAAMRKAITSSTRVVNEVTFSTFFTAAQSTLAIEEAGIFGSSTAGAGENSGVMFARWLSSFDNSGGLYDLTFDYLLQIG